MAVTTQDIQNKYAVYCGDCCEIMPNLKPESIHLSIYSPPFGGLYHYSSSNRDLANALTYKDFFKHYEFVVREISRLTIPGRITAVHSIDFPLGNSGRDYLIDFPGDIIRLHQKIKFDYIARYHIWREPLTVRNKTMVKKLAHRTIVEDSSLCSSASADYLLVFRKRGDNPTPVTHPQGFTKYIGERLIPNDLLKYRNWDGLQKENKYSHWIWRQYASAFWDDIRIARVLPYKEGREEEDEKHIHPLQLDVIERTLILWSNPGETILTPFMGVGSEVCAALANDRKSIGIELKKSYYNQALKNIQFVVQSGKLPTAKKELEQNNIFDD